jgi:hypothetical protein
MRVLQAVVAILVAVLSTGCEWMPAPQPTAPGSPTSVDVAPRTTATVNVNLTGTWQGRPEGREETLTLMLEHEEGTVKGAGTIAEAEGQEVEIAAFGTYFSVGRVNLSLHAEDDEAYADANFNAPVEADAMTGILKMEGRDYPLTLHRVAR